MTESKSSESINLYFGGLPNSGILDKSGDGAGSLKFIILQNDELHKQVDEMKTQVKELENEVAELEASNDSLEKTRNCLQGYVKNEHEIAKQYKSLYIAQQNIENYLVNTLMIFMVITIMMTMIENYYINTLILIGDITFLYGYTYKQYGMEMLKIKDIKKELKETEKANSYIDDLIDNM